MSFSKPWRKTRIFAAIIVTAGLAGCDLVGTMTRSFELSQQTAKEIESLTGSRPSISVRYENGQLTSATVTFPKPLETGDFGGLTRTIRRVFEARFQRSPKRLVIGFQVAEE